jgi:hypothetical protein
MSVGILQRMRRSRLTRTGHGLWLALALLLLTVQTALPAHEASHPIGQADTLCQYCVLGGHLYSLPSVATPPPVPHTRWETSHGSFVFRIVAPFPRTLFSRGPPLTSLA